MTDRIDCDRCAVTYRPDLTDGACPICRTPAPGFEVAEVTARLDLLTVVVAVSAVDFLLLALAAWWVFG